MNYNEYSRAITALFTKIPIRKADEKVISLPISIHGFVCQQPSFPCRSPHKNTYIQSPYKHIQVMIRCCISAVSSRGSFGGLSGLEIGRFMLDR